MSFPLDLFRRTAEHVPAYRAFLEEHGVDPASVRRSCARNEFRKTCSKRDATASSSPIVRGQSVGSPVDPDENAIMSLSATSPVRQRSESGYFAT